jgi:hypothetical protein
MQPAAPLAPEAPAGLDVPAAGLDALPPPVEERPPGLAAAFGALWNDLRETLHERVHLATLEIRLAGLTFVQLVFYAVLAAVLVVTAWLGLVVALVTGFVHWWSLHWGVGVAVGVVLNLALAGLLTMAMLKLLHRLDLHSSLRRLQGRPGAGPRE